MSRHEGVSCDSCLKGNFKGRRYKCLICYDYDLCATCYESGVVTTRHTADHPMQCILTRTDFGIYYGGEELTAEQPQAFSCPYCGKMGFTETTLQDHVSAEHGDAANEVVCPICAALPGGDPNHVTDDFAAHLALEHRRDFQDEPLGGGNRHVRRVPHPGRGMSSSRARRSNMHFQPAGPTLSAMSPNARENSMDPIAELLSQLSNVRSRAAAAQSVSSQLHQLEMQLQSTNTSIFSPRQQLERLPRRLPEAAKAPTAVVPPTATTILDFPAFNNSSGSGNSNSQYLLQQLNESDPSELERQSLEIDRADRGLFLQELLLSTLAEGLRLDEDEEANATSPISVEAPVMETEVTEDIVDTSPATHPVSTAPSPPRSFSSRAVNVKSGTSLGATVNIPSSNGEVPESMNAPVPTNAGRLSPRATRSPSPGLHNPLLAARGPPSMVKHRDLAQAQERDMANSKQFLKH